MRRGGFLILCLVLLEMTLLDACGSHPAAQSSTGIAYVGPQTLNLRKELGPKAPTIAILKQGEKLDVIETRHAFAEVRNAEGVEGWTEISLLLSAQQMDDLNRLAESAASFPSEGAATVYEALNIHASPNRESPSFFKIPEAGVVDVIGHKVAPRIAPEPAMERPIVHKAARHAKGKSSKQAFTLPMPVPPPPPRDWIEMSHRRAATVEGKTSGPPAKPIPLEDWDLVRTRDRKAGWVLARMLSMMIPDEVQQYAEGHRITSYVALDQVKDQDSIKSNWLWTTSSESAQDYEFDSFRVFVWSTRRHRYETAYIERNVRGYYPVETQGRGGQEERTFSLVLSDKDGRLYKKTYGFSGYHVRMISKALYTPPASLPEVRTTHDFSPLPAPSAPDSTWREKLSALKKRWFR